MFANAHCSSTMKVVKVTARGERRYRRRWWWEKLVYRWIVMRFVERRVRRDPLIRALRIKPVSRRVDKILLKSVSGVRSFWVRRGGYIDGSAAKDEVIELPRDTVGFHIYEFEERRFAWSRMIEAMAKSMRDEVVLRVCKLVQAAVPASDVPHVSQMWMARQSYPQGTVVFGSAAVIAQSWAEPGIDIALERIDPDDPIHRELYVIEPGALAMFSWPWLTKAYLENDAWYKHFLGRRDISAIIYSPAGVHRYAAVAAVQTS